MIEFLKMNYDVLSISGGSDDVQIFFQDSVMMEEGRSPTKTGLESPLTDDEITKDEAPPMEQKLPLPSNGDGVVMDGDGDGYIIPTSEQIDETPEVEDTRL